ncbi:MAG TPA: hypothetical protein VHQ47_08335 [Phycisphaerae bacterium]|nr:hypothetical protein [Phycisphaerae bacterium]
MESQGMNERGVERGNAVSQGWRSAEAPYMVLRHTGGGGGEGDHYDLLIDGAGTGGGADERRVWTWRIFVEPAKWGPQTPAERIADHRVLYMTYEGAVSGGRGEVRRIAGGIARLEAAREGMWEVRLCGIGEGGVRLRLPA